MKSKRLMRVEVDNPQALKHMRIAYASKKVSTTVPVPLLLVVALRVPSVHSVQD